MPKLYLVRLIPALRSPEMSGVKVTLMPQAERAYATREAAEKACLAQVPKVNPFTCYNLRANQDSVSVEWGGDTTGEYWEHMLLYDTLSHVILSIKLNPPISTLLANEIESHPKLSLWKKIQALFASSPYLQSPVAAWEQLQANKKMWVDWWEVNAPEMTHEQKRTIWELLANGNPYEVIEVELEG
jgi:hypothetical protein